MSRGLKTIQELLEEALVPEEEQPYEIPENWVWTHVDTVTQEIKNGTTIKQNKDELGVKVTRIESVQNNKIDLNRIGYIENVGLVKENDYYQTDDIVLSHINSIEHVGKTTLIKERYLPLVHGMNLLRIRLFKEFVCPEYAQYYMMSYQFRKDVRERVNRAVNQVSLNQKSLKEIPVPLAPLNEQKRIAKKVERLLSKIEEAKQLIIEAKRTFNYRRAAILDKAFRGELTRKWRVENGVKIEDWKIVDFDEVAFAIDPQPSHRTPAISDDGIPYIGVKDCDYETGEIDFINARHVSKSVLDEHINRYSINNGDFIIGKIGTIGKPFSIPTERNYVLSANVILIKPKTELVIPKYLFYLFQSSHMENQLSAGINATTQAAFGIKKVRKLNVNLCPLAEQQKIVKMLDDIFDNESRAKELSKEIQQIDTLKTSILQKAFQGELGTNDPKEEKAIELLKEVIQEQVK